MRSLVPATIAGLLLFDALALRAASPAPGPYHPIAPQGQGCCSWHGGQCGCEGNRVVCCDGTLSPTCTC